MKTCKCPRFCHATAMQPCKCKVLTLVHFEAAAVFPCQSIAHSPVGVAGGVRWSAELAGRRSRHRHRQHNSQQRHVCNVNRASGTCHGCWMECLGRWAPLKRQLSPHRRTASGVFSRGRESRHLASGSAMGAARKSRSHPTEYCDRTDRRPTAPNGWQQCGSSVTVSGGIW